MARPKAVPISTVDVGDVVTVYERGEYVDTTVTGEIAHIGYAGRKRILHAADNTIIGSYIIGEREPETWLVRAHVPAHTRLFDGADVHV